VVETSPGVAGRLTRVSPVSDLSRADVAETVRSTTSGEVTARAAVEEALARIAATDPGLNAFSRVLAREARAEADARDADAAAGGVRGPLHGVPVAIKEEIDVAGTVTTFGGEGNSTPASADAEVVRRLRAAGAVVVGKTTMPEFGAFPFTESSSRGLTRNPWDRTRTPGGSSGGTAAAVASGMVPVAMGGDGGGSIRIPSASCGLFGLKPQRGRVSTSPHPHLWFALGTAGPLTRTVLDSAIVYDVIRGNVDGDLYRAGGDASFVEAAGRAPGRLRIGWSVKPVTLGVRPDPLHVRAVADTARLLAELGHDVREIDPRYPDPTTAFVPQFLGGVRAEAALVEHYDRLERRTRQTCRMGAWVRPRVIERALADSEKVSVKANRVFDDVDVLLTPAIAHRPPLVGRLDGVGTVGAALRAMPSIAYAALWNVAGNPAASVPCGIADDGLPLAVQLVGRTDDEATLFSLSAQLERSRPWPLVAGDPATR
jgi:amidase